MEFEDFRARVEARRREVRDHPGQVALVRWSGVRRVADIHRRNYLEIATLLRRARDDVAFWLALTEDGHNPPRDEFEALVDQRLHNYVASTGSLVYHTRILVRRYPGSDFAAEYEARKDVVTQAPVTSFFNGLRNFVLHQAMPWTAHTLSFGVDNATFDVLLSAGPLLAAWEWGAPGRRLLEASGGTVNLLDQLEAHGALLRDLYSWLSEEFTAMHGADVAAVTEMKRSFNEWATAIRGDVAR